MSGLLILFVILALALPLALVAGQLRVAYRAINQGKAGLGRFAFMRAETPHRFWFMVAAEWSGWLVLFVFALVLLTKGLFG